MAVALHLVRFAEGSTGRHGSIVDSRLSEPLPSFPDALHNSGGGNQKRYLRHCI